MYMKCKNFCIRLIFYMCFIAFLDMLHYVHDLSNVRYGVVIICNLHGMLLGLISSVYIAIFNKLKTLGSQISMVLLMPWGYIFLSIAYFVLGVAIQDITGYNYKPELGYIYGFNVSLYIPYYYVTKSLAAGYVLFIIEVIITLIKKHKKF